MHVFVSDLIALHILSQWLLQWSGLHWLYPKSLLYFTSSPLPFPLPLKKKIKEKENTTRTGLKEREGEEK